MKKIRYSICLIVILSFVMTGCHNQVNANRGESLNVVTTIFAPYDFVRQVAGDRVNLTMLLKPGEESHSYEPTPQDIISIANCDIFIYVGGENDAWIDDIMESIDTSNMKILKLLDMVENKYQEEYVEGMDGVQDEHGHDHNYESHEEWDEHVWTSPVNAMLICNEITDVLCESDENNSLYYRENNKKYQKELNELDEAFREVINNSNRKTVVFGDRFPLRYFVEEYGLDYYAAFPGCASESEASAATIAFLIDEVKRENIPVVFKIELSNSNMADAIAEDSGCKVMTFYTCHNLTADDFNKGETYVSLMYRNVESLKEALN